MQNIRYNYATRPKVLSNSTNKIKQILRTGNAEKLEKLIRDGYGYKLIGEHSSIPRIRSLLKSVPFYMARIDMLHDAVTKGQLRDVQVLLNTTSPAYSQLKPKAENLVISKDNAGVGLLHKAVYYDHPEIIEWLVRIHPSTVHVRDKLGRIPLHYVNSTSEPDRIWKLLVEAGANINAEDVNGKTAEFYYNNNTEIHLPGKTNYHDLYDEGITIKPPNIRIWIHDQDMDRLQQVIWEGQGEKLRAQTSNKPLMKKFLSGIPYVMAMIQEIHKAAIQDDIDTLINHFKNPIPPVILTSKDTKGGTALHKACGLGNAKVVDYVLNTYSEAVHISDNEGRTPVHYAASFKQDEIYEKLLKFGGKEHIIDKNGKTAKYYRSKPGEIDKSVLLEMPPAPRADVANINSSSFDWSILRTSQKNINEKLGYVNQVSNTPKKLNIVKENDDNFQLHSGLKDSCQKDDVTKYDVEDKFSNVNMELSSFQQEIENELDKLSYVNGEATEKHDFSFSIIEQGEAAENDTPNCKSKENDNIHENTNNSPCHGIENYEENQNQNTVNHEVECHSETTVRCEESTLTNKLFENVLYEEPIHNTTSQPNIEDLRTANVTEQRKFIPVHKLQHEELDMRKVVNEVIKKENLDDIANLILEGHGEWLLNAKSNNRQIREFILQLPIYLKKIELIHYCCEVGSIEELRKHLDRRKFALARENKTMLYLTPLHIAVIHNRRNIIRYLAGRFPETFNTVDKLGRTPLHFASIHPDGKFVYNMLLTLGADKSMKDDDGYSAEYYYEHSDDERYHQLLQMVNKSKNTRNTGIINLPQLDEITNLSRLENDYLTSVLGEALKTGLSAIIHIRPPKPIKFLADYLYSYKEETTIKQDVGNVVETVEQTSPPTPHLPLNAKKRTPQHNDVLEMNFEGTLMNQFQPLSRDKYGQTVIHFEAAREHGRNGLLQMLLELNGNVAYRDELYRTARDVAALSELYENVKAIDEYVLHIAANGGTGKVIQLIKDGYDHVLDTETNENVIDVVTSRKHNQTLAFLRKIPLLEETREKLHCAIRRGDKAGVIDIFRKCGKDAELMAICRNDTFRCSLHISVLTQQKSIVKYVVKRFPQTLHIGDNLERTPLHYAMALKSVEEFTNILIRAGAKRIAKDLKGRQPSYYFMNKTEIIRMQREEMYLNNEPGRDQ